MQPIFSFYPELDKPVKVVVTMHQKPDADAMGSSLGLMHFLKKKGQTVTVISPTNWAGFLNWLPGSKEVIDAEAKREVAAELIQNADVIYCLDFNNLARTKSLEKKIEESPAMKILIDHHQEPQTEQFNYGVSDTGKCATAEMIYDFIKESGNRTLIDTEIATCLYAGVLTDTGSFRFASTSASTHSMIADLKQTGLQHHLIHENLFDTFLENRLRFFGHVLLNRMDVDYEMNTVLITIPKSDLLKFDIKTGDSEGLVNYPLSMQGIKMAAIVIDRDEERKWSFRSKGNVDVNTFARKYFEGGGHKNAAGGRSSASLEDTAAYFKEVLPSMSDVLKTSYL